MGERIIETWIQAKHPNQELCEDGLYTGRHYFAVIDGVTSKGSLCGQGKRQGADSPKMYFWVHWKRFRRTAVRKKLFPV